MKDHSWVFDVLKDLEHYCEVNELQNLNRTLKETIFAAKLDEGVWKIKNQRVIQFPNTGSFFGNRNRP